MNWKTATEDKIGYIKTLISFLERKIEDHPVFFLPGGDQAYICALEEVIKALKLDIETLEKQL